MSWIQIDVTIREHDKIYNLADTLKIPDSHAVGLMVCLWTWAVSAAPDGDITNFPPRALAKAAGWDKKPELFLEAICSPASMFVEQIDGHLVFRNWDKRAALLMDAIERGKENTRKRVQRYRERKAAKANVTYNANASQNTDSSAVTESQHDKEVTRYSNDCNVTVTPLPYHTITNHTIPKDKEDKTTTTSSNEDEAAEAATRPEFVPFKKIIEMYNSTCTRLRKITSIEGERKKAVTARYKKHGIDVFQTLFEKANASEFLCGGGSKNWTADFDWLMNITNMAKVLEGKYDNQANSSVTGTGNPFFDYARELSEGATTP